MYIDYTLIKLFRKKEITILKKRINLGDATEAVLQEKL